MRLLAIVLVLLATGATGCAGAASTGSAPTSPAEPTSEPVAGGEDPAGTRPALPPARTVREGVQDPRPREFEEALFDETDGSFHVVYWTGVEPCHVLADVRVEEDDQQITITLHEGHLPDEHGDAPVCIEVAEHVSTPVTLDAPPGERTVNDGATGQEVPLSVITADEASLS